MNTAKETVEELKAQFAGEEVDTVKLIIEAAISMINVNDASIGKIEVDLRTYRAVNCCYLFVFQDLYKKGYSPHISGTTLTLDLSGEAPF